MDNWEDSESLPPEESVESNLTSIVELRKQQNISRTTVYRRMKRLRIKPWKKGSHFFLDRQQVGYMNGLNEHYQKTGKLEGFPIPEPTGPWEETSTPSNIPPIESEDNQDSIQETTENFPVGNLQKIIKAHKERCRAARRRGQVSVHFWHQKLRLLLIVSQGSTQLQSRSDRSLNLAESING